MSVANSYAKALFEAASEAKTSADELDRLESQMDAFLDLISQSKEAKHVFYSPVITGREKSTAVEAVADKVGFSKLLKNFLSLMATKGRLSMLPEVRSAFGAVRLEAEGGVRGTLVAADKMADEDLKGLAQSFTKKLGKKVAFNVTTDPSLLAGMKVTVNGVTYDGTLRSQLLRLRDRIVLGMPQQK